MSERQKGTLGTEEQDSIKRLKDILQQHFHKVSFGIDYFEYARSFENFKPFLRRGMVQDFALACIDHARLLQELIKKDVLFSMPSSPTTLTDGGLLRHDQYLHKVLGPQGAVLKNIFDKVSDLEPSKSCLGLRLPGAISSEMLAEQKHLLTTAQIETARVIEAYVTRLSLQGGIE